MSSFTASEAESLRQSVQCGLQPVFRHREYQSEPAGSDAAKLRAGHHVQLVLLKEPREELHLGLPRGGRQVPAEVRPEEQPGLGGVDLDVELGQSGHRQVVRGLQPGQVGREVDGVQPLPVLTSAVKSYFNV